MVVGIFAGRFSALFVPWNEKHAIQEVVFALTFNRAVDERGMQTLLSEHQKFKTDLPKAERGEVFQFAIGAAHAAPPTVTRPMVFSAFKRDGSIDWRMAIEENAVSVNCLTYTRWDDVSARAIGLLRHVATGLASSGLLVTGSALQYVDTFKWTGKTDDYRRDMLLRNGSRFIPAALIDSPSDPMWHLHQGVLTPTSIQGLAGKLLDRVHMDAVLENGNYIVRIDSLLRFEFGKPPAMREALFDKSGGFIHMVVNDLHKRNKAILVEYLAPELAVKIGLAATE